MNLIEAAEIIERLRGRAAHNGELDALKIARDAVLTIVSEGFATLEARLRADVQVIGEAGVASPGNGVVRGR